MHMRAEAVIDGEDADGNQASGHQNVTEKKNDRDAGHGRAEEPEADPIQKADQNSLAGSGGMTSALVLPIN
jgi:hypothetical protein